MIPDESQGERVLMFTVILAKFVGVRLPVIVKGMV